MIEGLCALRMNIVTALEGRVGSRSGLDKKQVEEDECDVVLAS